MTLRHILIPALAAAAALTASAQFPSMIQQIDQDFLRRAITPAVKVVRTTYFMADAELTQRYSSQTDTVFGYDYSLAYQTPDGFITTVGTVNPWATDPRFEEYRNSAEYTPLLNNRAYATLTDAPVYENLAMMPPVETAPESGLWLVRSENVPAGYMQAGAADTDTKGFMTWFVLPNGCDIQKNTDLNIKFSRFTPEFDSKGRCAAPALPATTGDIIGGIYVQPVPADNGTVTLRIAAVLTRTTPRGNTWQLAKIDMSGQPADETPATEPENTNDNGDKGDLDRKPID